MFFQESSFRNVPRLGESPGTLQSADSVLFCLYNPKVSVDGAGSGTPPACSIYQTRVEESQQQMLANNVPKQPALVKFTDDGRSCKGGVRMIMGNRGWKTGFVSRMIIQVYESGLDPSNRLQ